MSRIAAERLGHGDLLSICVRLPRLFEGAEVLGYRTVLTADGTTENIDAILRVLRRWVIVKKRFPDIPAEGVVENASGAVLTVSSFQNESANGLRWQLIEEWEPPQWLGVEHSTRTAVTHVSLVVSKETLWFWVDIEPPSLSIRDRTGRLVEDAQYSGTPSFMSEVIEAVRMRDGLAEPRSGFQVIGEVSGIDQLVDIVQDGTRIGAVYVTAPPASLSIDDWVEQSNSRSYAMQGLAMGYVLSSDAS